MVQQLPLLVQADGFTAGAETGVHREHSLAPERRGQEQLAQVGGKDADGLLVGPFLERHPQLGFERPAEQPAIPVVQGRTHLRGIVTGSPDEGPLQEHERIGFRGEHGEVQDILGLAAAHGQDAVGRGRCGRLLPFEVVAVLGSGSLRAGGDPADDDGLAAEELPQQGARRGVFVDDFGDDVAGSGQSVLGSRYPRCRVHVLPGGRHRVRSRLVEQQARQGVEALLARDHGARATFGAIGQVEVFQRREALNRLHALPEILGEVPVLLEGFQNCNPPRVEFCQLLQPVAHGRDGHFVQAPGGFLAIPGDEGHGGLRGQQGGHRSDLSFLKAELARDDADVMDFHGSPSRCDRFNERRCRPMACFRDPSRASAGRRREVVLYSPLFRKSSARRGVPTPFKVAGGNDRYTVIGRMLAPNR